MNTENIVTMLTYPSINFALLRAACYAVGIYSVLFFLKNVPALIGLLPKLSHPRIIVLMLISVVLEVFGSEMIADAISRAREPIYADTWTRLDAPTRAGAFEQRLQSLLSPTEFGVVQQWTDSTARAIGCTAADIYAVAACECSLNPFTIRTDDAAAGWIQFTRVGVQHVPGLTYSDVRTACQRRDVRSIMQWSHQYLVATCAGKTIRDHGDVYLAVFAPAFVGAPDDRVLYAGKSNPAYYLNAGLDGWTRRADGSIIRLNTDKDFQITAGELRLRVAYMAAKSID
jgi:hypothetical protein